MKKILLSGIAAAATLAMMADDAKYVFYFIGDGMGLGHVNATEAYNRDVLKSEQPILMMTFPVASQARTYSASSPITDSAAAGTALSTGVKTKNSMIGMNPDTVPVNSIAVDFMKAGYAVGVGTTVQADDATPAAWYAHAENRGMKETIAPQAAASGLSFLAGGGFKLHGAGEEAFVEFLNTMRKGNYEIAEGYAAFNELKRKGGKFPQKVMLMPENAAGGQVGYTIDSIPGYLTCAQITEACLHTLESVNPDKFLMMIEGGNIDWAAHSNDGGGVIKEILNFQDAINVAYQFYLRHPAETLIVVTADHDTGAMAYGRNGGAYNIAYADAQKISKDSFADWTRNWGKDTANPTWEEMEQVLKEKLGFWTTVPVGDRETKELKELFDETFISKRAEDEKTLYHTFNAFTSKAFAILNYHMGIGWTTTYHAGNFVPVYAIGANAQYFTGSLNNNEIPQLIKRACGVE
ncbi:MAG: alkaline phosphatase [Muribaculaceae bacterium]|nr:alkaline phosphatase [Muribaculaceae bacterium]